MDDRTTTLEERSRERRGHIAETVRRASRKPRPGISPTGNGGRRKSASRRSSRADETSSSPRRQGHIGCAIGLDSQMLGLRISERGTTPQLLQKGLRKPLLCEACEVHLNTHFEQPSLKSWHALAKMEDDSSFVSKFVETDLGYEATLLEGFDYPTLKLFLLSILWRAGVSSRGEFRQVELGPHEEQLRRILLERNPGSVGDYTCLLFLMKQDFKGIHIPWLTRFEGRVGYRFLLGRVLLWFLATRGFESNRFIQAALTENGGWVAHMVERDGLPEFEAAARMAVSIEIPERLLRP